MVKNIIIILQLIIIIILSSLIYSIKKEKKSSSDIEIIQQTEQENPYNNSNLSFELIESENNTWGYKIYLEGSTFIIQSSKPGLPGNEGFKNRSDAEKVAEFVIKKIRNGEMPPTVGLNDLKDLGVL